MQTFRLTMIGALLTALAVLAAANNCLRAEDEEAAVIVRVSDEQPARAVPALAPVAVDPPPASRQRPVRWAQSHETSYPSSGYAAQPGDCSNCGGPTCESGCGYCVPQSYGLPLGALCCHCRLHRLPKIRKGCNRSPDFGWSPPSELPVTRVPVGYQRYWPSRWTGEEVAEKGSAPPQFPVVYMPTDTTQLGYYYSIVPSWQPNRAMLPPAPRSEDWHCRGCPTVHAPKPRCNFGVHQTMTPGSCPNCRHASHATW